ncbi:hypothetical protein IC575_004511 [Cucumis melo]
MLRKLEFQVSEEDHTKELRAFTLACDIALWHCTVARRGHLLLKTDECHYCSFHVNGGKLNVECGNSL